MGRDEQGKHIFGRRIAMESTLILTGSVVLCVMMLVFGTLVAVYRALVRSFDPVTVDVDGMRNWD